MSLFDEHGFSHKHGFYTFFTYRVNGRQYDGSHHSIKPNLKPSTIYKRLKKTWKNETITNIVVTHSTKSRFRVNRDEL